MVELSEPAQRPPLRRAAAASRRRRILDAAAELIESRGYERTTIDEVAALAGITKRTLYRYVDSKERLLYEIHEDFLDGLLQEVTALTGPPRERFGAMISAHMADLAAHQRDIKVFFEEVKHIDAAQRGLPFARRTAYASAVEGIIADGFGSGEFEVPDVRLAVRGLLGAMNEAYRWYDPGGALSVAELSARLTDLFLFGIDATPSPAAAEIPVAELDRRMAAPEAEVEAGRRVRSQLRSVYEQVRAIVEGGQRDGEFRDTDPGVATLVVLGLINSTYRWYQHEAGFSPGVLASSLPRLVRHGIGSPALRAETGMADGASVPPAPTAPARPERSSS
jgi:AcrR family transcriptional regulator